jgi:SMI1/KNR4 family protein SUKH-1
VAAVRPDEVDKIEQALEVKLPDAYRRLVEAFPVPAFAGNSDLAFWDHADRLIEYNRELRSGPKYIKPWPTHFYALGRDSGGCSQAIDLRTGELWWADRGHLEGGQGTHKHTESFEEWAATYFKDLREDFAGEGGDPSGTPQQRAEFEARNARASARRGLGCLFIVVLGVAILVAWRLLR